MSEEKGEVPKLDLISIEFGDNPAELSDELEINFEFTLSTSLTNAYWDTKVLSFIIMLFFMLEF